jgi:hypothetical protein
MNHAILYSLGIKGLLFVNVIRIIHGNRHIQPASRSASSVDALCPGIHLYSPFSHLGIFQELQWMPDQMALDLCQLLSNFIRWKELVEDMPRLDAPGRKVAVIILKGFDWSPN